ncbi:histidine kinase [Saccharopolyspora sp. 6V]|uniref:sensor histidine kinase n=1 Tax=Saccharopolyspora sp. 6V TaxID=2877239 RepID=UPI001CD63915|nr:histidine kinase [Saccharopolyspora sp. 6V]MCA1191396.1 histidine kinase [Saccharopolyspora sp. 6V]
MDPKARSESQQLDAKDRSWSTADRVLAVAVCLAVFVATFLPAGALVAEPAAFTSIPGLALTLLIATLSAVVTWLAPRWSWPLYALAFGTWLIASLWPLLCVASFRAALRLRSFVLATYAVAATAAVMAPTLVRVRRPDVGWDSVQSSFGGVALFVVLPLFIGLWVKARRQVVEGLRERTQQLLRSQEARAEQARAQERSRIAREMHDVVAHRVSLMVLHAGAIEANSPNELLADEAALIRRTGREALGQLREVLGVLRLHPSEVQLQPQATVADIEDLVERSRSAGLDVRYRCEGTPVALPAMVDHTAYRLAQEALTNVHKHAGTARTEVTVRYLTSAVEVGVSNAAPERVSEGLPGSGLGLVGLHERVGLLHGTLTTGPTPDGGFSVQATLPTTPVESGGSTRGSE